MLIFWRLDGTPLWRDEGTTAVWARGMAEHGSWLPYVYYDDQLTAQASDGHDVSSRLLPAMQSYLQFYVAAASFKLLGADTWTARLPFALAGALSLAVLWRIGRLFSGPIGALAFPAGCVLSIFFLHAARQSRYYVLVVLATCWVLYEIARLLKDRSLETDSAFYLRLGAAGLLVYFSNYLSFLGLWSAVGVFVLAERSAALVKRFVLLSAAMAVVVLADFTMLHFEFVAAYPPPLEAPLWVTFQGALANRGKDIWRALPLIFLVPAGYWAVASYLGRQRPLTTFEKACAVTGTLVILSPLAFHSRDAKDWSTPVFWLYATSCLALPLGFVYLWSRIKDAGPAARMVWLCGLILVLSPSLAIAAGKNKALTRHFYQILPAAVVIAGLAVTELQRRRGTAPAAALLATCVVWPNIDWTMGGTEQVVQRQYLLDRSYNAPLFDYLKENVTPGDRIAFYRNVKGMPAYFYVPEMRWVELLDSEAPHNQQLRGLIADNQFDDAAVADWYVVWDPRGGSPRGLNAEDFELVWEYSYSMLVSPWDRAFPAGARTYQVYRRR